MQQILSVQELLTGEHWISECVIVIENGKVSNINKEGYDHKNSIPLVVPALIDLQIYGADEKLLSEFPTADTIQKIYNYCLASGTAYFQPTLATQSWGVIYKCIDAVRDYKANGGKGCIGLHIEGPWINPLKKGAHSNEHIHQPTLKEAQDLLDYGKDHISMITLAPEMVDASIISGASVIILI